MRSAERVVLDAGDCRRPSSFGKKKLDFRAIETTSIPVEIDKHRDGLLATAHFSDKKFFSFFSARRKLKTKLKLVRGSVVRVKRRISGSLYSASATEVLRFADDCDCDWKADRNPLLP